MRTQILVVISVLLVAGLACSLSGAGGGTGTPAPTENVLYQDDFSDTGSGWTRLADDAGLTDYESDAYRFRVDQPNKFLWEGAHQNFSVDVSVRVDATKTAGPEEGDIGVMCRYDADGKNFYFFTFSPHGYAAIGLWQGSDYTVLTESDNNSFGASDQVHTITADCVGSTLTLSVDGKQVHTTQDSTLTSGDAGLIVGTYDEAGVDVTFDNFKVTAPE
jgi:hypothetical protein